MSKMLTQTLDTVLSHFGFLRSKIDEVVTNDVLKSLKSLWIKYKGYMNPYIKRVSVTGIDSSYNYIEYRGFALYAINTVSVLLDLDIETEVNGNIDVDITSSPNIEYELSLLSMCMEINAVSSVMSKSDLVLIDGSLIAMFSKLYKASIDNNLEILDNKGINVSDILKKLIYTVTLNPRKLVFISKNSSSKDLLGLVKGDIYYLERYTDFEPGYSKPSDLLHSKHLGISTIVRLFKRYVKNLVGLDTSIGLTYVRLDNFARVYRIEMVIDQNEDIDDRVRSIINILSEISISGYPYPLMRAHMLAKIGDRDVERIAILLGIAKDPRDREAFLM